MSDNTNPAVEEVVAALAVVAYNERIRKFLEENDPKALQQITKALNSTQYNCSEYLIAPLLEMENIPKLIGVLDTLKGSYAVQYFLAVLVRMKPVDTLANLHAALSMILDYREKR